jgi:hypothetical protein
MRPKIRCDGEFLKTFKNRPTSWGKFLALTTIAISFVFNNYYPIMEGSKDLSHKLQVNRIISYFLSIFNVFFIYVQRFNVTPCVWLESRPSLVGANLYPCLFGWSEPSRSLVTSKSCVTTSQVRCAVTAAARLTSL